MNKIYKVIYSKVKQCYVVVSEIARSHTKGPQRASVCGRKLASLAVAVATGFVFWSGYTGTALALDGEDNQEPGKHATVVGGKGNSAWGTDATIAGGSDNNSNFAVAKSLSYS